MAKTRWLFIHPFQLRLQRGIEVYLWNLASALAQNDIDVDILTWAGPLDVPNYVQTAGVRVLRVPSMRYFQHIFAIPFYIWYLLTGKYAQVFVHFAGYGEGPALKIAHWFRPVDFSVVFHFPPSLVPHRFREFEHWGFQQDAKHLIAVSQSTAGEVKAWAGRSCNAISHGVDTERFKPDTQLRLQVRKQLGISSDAPVLISVAALEERKGIQWGIKAMPMLLPEHLDLYYFIVGDGSYRKRLEEMVAELGLKEHVHFLGRQSDVQPYLCAADIMLVLSQGDASSISLLEAMACQLPSVASLHPPFDELVKESWGVRVDERNTQQINLAISELIKKYPDRLRMGTIAREYVIEHHPWSRIAEYYFTLVGN